MPVRCWMRFGESAAAMRGVAQIWPLRVCKERLGQEWAEGEFGVRSSESLDWFCCRGPKGVLRLFGGGGKSKGCKKRADKGDASSRRFSRGPGDGGPVTAPPPGLGVCGCPSCAGFGSRMADASGLRCLSCGLAFAPRSEALAGCTPMPLRPPGCTPSSTDAALSAYSDPPVKGPLG